MHIVKSIFAIIAAMLLWVGIADAQGIARSSNQSMASTLNAAVIADLFEQQSVTSFYVSGLTASGATLTVEGSSDGKNDTDSTKSWFAVNALPSTCPPTPFTTLTADQGIRVDTAALTNVRVRVSTAGTGTIAVSYNAIPGTSLSTSGCGAGGGTGGSSIPYEFTPLGSPQYNQTATTAKSLNPPPGALYARICAVGGGFNFVDDISGAAPTTGAAPTVGTPLAAGSCIFEQGPAVLAIFQLINAVASTGTWVAVFLK